MTEMNCGNCVYFRPTAGSVEDRGNCRLYPPEYVKPRDIWAQPQTRSSGWCGEWESIDNRHSFKEFMGRR